MATVDYGDGLPNTSEYERKKWFFLKNAPKKDAEFPRIRVRAGAILVALNRTPWLHYNFACVALSICQDCIVYKLDTDRVGREQIDGFTDSEADPDTPLIRGFDDCDGKARLFVALCLAAGIPSEMVPRWDVESGRLAHVYARAYVAAPESDRHGWWLAETILRRARLGDVAEQVPVEPETGKWSQ